jgi:WhiB family redox-sensing transcriptional regulator
MESIDPVSDLSWKELAKCRGIDPSIFYDDINAEEAKSVCEKCGVAALCLAYALRRPEDFGIWGGKDERERRKMRKFNAQAGESA